MKNGFLCLSLVLVACSSKEEPKANPETKVAPPPAAGARRVELAVTDKGFEPSPVTVKAGEPLELLITRKTDKTCATEIVVKDYGIEKRLPLNEPVLVAFTPKAPGEIKYGCAMDQMIAGVLVVE
jgi:plastocyanin domain-containing protein